MSIVVPLRGFLFALKPDAAARLGIPKETRPWVIVQSNDVPNKYGSVVACYTTCAIDARGKRKTQGPLQVLLEADAFNGLTEHESYIVCSNLYTIRHDELGTCFGSVNPSSQTMRKVDQVLRKVLGL
jgi:mRNA-degrading endonuclease toxin of MazEF toxin-antitoxin module